MKNSGPKIIISIVLILMLVISAGVIKDVSNDIVGTSSNSENADKVYNINSADFNILINDDGSARITETWEVSYQKGEFSRFYKNILMDLPESESFNGIKNFSANIDGIPCTPTDDTTGRPDGHVALTKNGKIATYELFKKSENQTRQFQVNYTLPDIIKLVDNEYYFFSYRALPKGYQKKIDDFKITVELANPTTEAEIELKYLTDGKPMKDGKKIIITAHNVNDLQKIQLKITGKTFIIPETSKISNVSNNNSTSDDADATLFEFTIVMIICVFIWLKTIVGNIKRRKLVLKNPRIVEEYIVKWRHRITPYKIICLLSKNSHLSFFLGLAMAYQKKYIDFSYDGEEITWKAGLLQNSPEDDLKPVIDILSEIGIYCDIHNFPYKIDNNFITISMSNIQIFFEQSTSYKLTRDLLIDLDINSVFPDKKERKQFNKDLKEMRALFNYLSQKTDIKFETILFNPMNINTSLDFVNQYLKESHAIQTVYGYAKIDEIIAFIHTKHVEYCKTNKLNAITGLAITSSSSSSSSCGSSCSSCGGGCGGCGGCGGSD